ncbi:MAG: hypothetical protein IJ216_05165 [Acidaminococcaceae bacterium]|nr:hypothetical protein [Acidaminococcaceae bacterium]MBQ9284421.1 hypothetical protein [Acidaminococcaceae bacterium]
MKVRFNEKRRILDVAITGVSAMASVGIMLYGVYHFGLAEAWPELVLNGFYIACLVMMWMYFFNMRITTEQFNYWSSLSIGVTVILRDILFPPPMASYAFGLACRTLSVLLVCTLTYFYARKDWLNYTKRNLWFILVIDMLIAASYHIDIVLFESVNEYTDYILTEIWIRSAIIYGLVACFVSETAPSDDTASLSSDSRKARN